MLIIGVPKNIEDYIIVDGENVWNLTKAGFHPKYQDPDDKNVFFFRKTNKLLQYIDKLEETM